MHLHKRTRARTHLPEAGLSGVTMWSFALCGLGLVAGGGSAYGKCSIYRVEVQAVTPWLSKPLRCWSEKELSSTVRFIK